MSLVAHASSASSSSSSSHHLREALWQMSMLSREQMESGHYPVREDEPDCSYYIRTGFCRFGATCRFNHPLNRKLAMATARMKGEYPERIGQPECEYFLRTGICKFGATCKFHHPRDKAGPAVGVALNVLGYPLRPNEVECGFYMRNGHCKFGVTCKFHHPQSSNMMVSLHGSTLYAPVHSATTNAQPVPGVPFIPGPQWQSPSSCAQLIMSQGVMSAPWNTYGQVGSVSPSKNQHQIVGNGESLISCQAEGTNVGFHFGSNTLPLGPYAFEGGMVFPERPGLPECQFYLKNGNCKFGPICKFHHPRERLIHLFNCVLSPIGLPLRPGEPKCVYYSQYGVCKFGPRCKFDHPMRAAAASSLTDDPDRFMDSSSGTAALSSSPDGLKKEALRTVNGYLPQREHRLLNLGLLQLFNLPTSLGCTKKNIQLADCQMGFVKGKFQPVMLSNDTCCAYYLAPTYSPRDCCRNICQLLRHGRNYERNEAEAHLREKAGDMPSLSILGNCSRQRYTRSSLSDSEDPSKSAFGTAGANPNTSSIASVLSTRKNAI